MGRRLVVLLRIKSAQKTKTSAAGGSNAEHTTLAVLESPGSYKEFQVRPEIRQDFQARPEKLQQLCNSFQARPET
eukprot:895462-Amphidinium_carterae.1